MGDVDHGEGPRFRDLFQLVAEEPPRDHVECGKGFIQEQQLRVPGQGLADGATLPLAARDLIGFAVSECRQAEKVHEGVHVAAVLRRKGSIAVKGQVREEGVILEDVTQLSFLRGEVYAPRRIEEDPVADRRSCPRQALRGLRASG